MKPLHGYLWGYLIGMPAFLALLSLAPLKNWERAVAIPIATTAYALNCATVENLKRRREPR